MSVQSNVPQGNWVIYSQLVFNHVLSACSVDRTVMNVVLVTSIIIVNFIISYEVDVKYSGHYHLI